MWQTEKHGQSRVASFRRKGLQLADIPRVTPSAEGRPLRLKGIDCEVAERRRLIRLLHEHEAFLPWLSSWGLGVETC